MATQQLAVNTAYTAPLTFQDANGNTVQGPIGSIASSDPSVTASLSEDGQHANCTMTQANITATLTWSGNGANGAFSFTVTVTDQPVGTTAVSGSFGTFVPGTTT